MPEEFNLPKIEEKFLGYWRKNQIFEKTLEKTKKKKHFVFFEGPPYANGKPGIHHVLARIYKDVILRYKTMRGYYVPRKAGWDTHGLPVEMAAEKALGLKSKKDIEKFGIKRFNEEAKKAVWLYKDEWEKMTERIGYWLDLKNAYVTYEPEYIETLWWTLAQIAKRGLLYKGHKVVPWCTRCGTALSSHELALGYKETEDNSVYVKFKIKKGQKISKDFVTDDKTYILSWTTTPWTLPGNVALAVGKEIEYVAVKHEREIYILAKDRPPSVIASDSEAIQVGIATSPRHVGAPRNDAVVQKFKGKDLVGLEYEPLFSVMPLRSKNSYKIYGADFVSTGEGTGVVHTAVMYGEDDYKLGQKVGLPQYHTVDEDGKFTKDVPGFAGMYVKSPETEKKLLDYLKPNTYNLKPYLHEYPYCWRCETPVLYYARNSWFIAMSKLRAKLLAANAKINWLPEHLKKGRFGEWLREVKDWNLSRERYWGAPLPIWECGKCGGHEVVGSLDELSERALRPGSEQAGGSHNKYWIMRHGESLANAMHVIDDRGKGGVHLTEKGQTQAKKSAETFKKQLAKNRQKIDIIIFSDIPRARETAHIVAEVLGIRNVSSDMRLEEIHLGELEGCHDKRYHELYPTYESKFSERPMGGESLRDLRLRLWQFLEDCEKKYEGKNILLVNHEYPIWMLEHAAQGWSEKQSIREKQRRGDDYAKLAEIRSLELRVVPRNDAGEADLHRPFADEITFPCKKCPSTSSGNKNFMHRVKEVADVWYDSGAMPFAQSHFPFDCARNSKSETLNSKQIPNSKFKIPNSCLDYPADYIAEGMDQTRGWFYTLLAVATALGQKAPYKNVVSLGLVNDKFGQKMSKSKGNVVDPWVIINKYGVDAVRWYFFTVNPPGETKNFDELEVQQAYRRMHLLTYNSLVFYQTYVGKKVSGPTPVSKNILDQWILARLNEAITGATGNLDKYEIRDAALEIERFVDDLSRWYIRRSRRRLQRAENKTDYDAASSTLGFILLSLAKLLAPFTPFFGEFIHSELCSSESVHLDEWPKANEKLKNKNEKLLEQMAEVRKLASAALARRAEAGIKVRQPLDALKIRNPKSEIRKNKALLAILAEEVNVKKIIFSAKITDEVELDTKITPELKEEGILRELARTVAELRQKAGLKPRDRIVVMLELLEPVRDIVLRNEEFLKKDVGATQIEYKRGKFTAEISTKIDGENYWLAVRKV
ncbi:MAG: class I tRNA ligase family protein [Patescibacteria group bacterium]